MAVGGDWLGEWMAQSCNCCLHLQRVEGWNPEWCQPQCCRARFPQRLYAEWDLMVRVVKREMFGVMTAMGGSMQTTYQVREESFEFWAGKVGRIPRKRWMTLIDLVERLHGEVEEKAEGKFGFTDADFEKLKRLVEAVGADGGQADTD